MPRSQSYPVVRPDQADEKRSTHSHRSAGNSRPARDFADRKRAVLQRLDFRAEYTALKVQFTASEPNEKGWLECRAINRPDRSPSAGVYLRTGLYRSFGDGAERLSFLDFAMKYGRFSDFQAVLEHYEAKLGISDRSESKITPRGDRESSTLGETSGALERLRSGKGSKSFPTFEDAYGAIGRSKKVNGEYAAHWSYADAEGEEILRVVRYRTSKGKTYRPFRPTDDGGWTFGDPEGLLPLYRLADLPEAGRIYVWEGEKVADLAGRLGLASTTSVHGANAADKTDWSPLAGREVVIVPDAGEAGEKYLAEVVKILGSLVPRPSIRALRLPGLEDGEDLEQWLERAPDAWEEDRTRAELERLADASPDPTKPPPPSREELGLACFEDIEASEVEWWWPDRIPFGKITLLAGEGEIGKTFIILEMIARGSRGRPHPDRPGVPTAPIESVFITAEDGLDDTIKPRLLRMGADCRLVFSVTTAKLPNGKLSPFTIADIGRLDQVVEREPGIKLIVIDPIAAFLGRVDENKNAELRGLLGPLADFADRRGVAIVAITHFNKTASMKARSRILGSVAYTNASRVAWCVFADPDDPDRRLMLRAKNNLCPDKTGLAYRIENGLVVWEPDPVEMTADAFLARESGGKANREQAAIETIRGILADGPLDSETVIERCAAAGIGKNRVWSFKQ